jgi:putative DNA primase/helicase
MINEMKSTPLLDAALELATKSIPVFPCRSKDEGKRKAKEPYTKHGFKDASTDPEQIREWWRRWPDAFIGMPTGETSGVWVLDIDVKRENGFDTLAGLEAEHGKLPDTLTATTRSGGEHRYFRMPPGADIGSRAGIAPGIDIRANRGYVITPPSPRLPVAGQRNTYRGGCDMNNPAISEAPSWLLDLAKGKKNCPTVPASREWDTGTPDQLPRVPDGVRNDTLVRQVGRWFHKGLDPREVLLLARAWSQALCEPPLEEERILLTVESPSGSGRIPDNPPR